MSLSGPEANFKKLAKKSCRILIEQENLKRLLVPFLQQQQKVKHAPRTYASLVHLQFQKRTKTKREHLINRRSSEAVALRKN